MLKDKSILKQKDVQKTEMIIYTFSFVDNT